MIVNLKLLSNDEISGLMLACGPADPQDYIDARVKELCLNYLDSYNSLTRAAMLTKLSRDDLKQIDTLVANLVIAKPV